ncbi:hypothetical protein R5R35_002802 [Gryllus longicercus]|uniref:DUF7775 domain-containing protein n=1 Tax=Gryllus longicercus TaxID=2509291 RepID=A0AAN9YZA6_9ORTH
MRSKTGVLVAIKLFQLVGGTACLTLHIYAYTTGLDVPHITVFCGTYMGFGLVNVAFLVSAVMGKPAAEELDMAFGAIGSVLFYTCGVLSMYQVRQKQYAEQERTNSLEIPNAYNMDPRFFIVTRAQAISSVVTKCFPYGACNVFRIVN